MILQRTVQNEEATYGVLILNNKPLCDTIERPWLDNHPQTSCIPPGEYEFETYHSPSKGVDVWLLKNVPNREYIEIHPANFAYELKGCIAPGQGYFRNKHLIGVGNSRPTFEFLKTVLPREGKITIKGA